MAQPRDRNQWPEGIPECARCKASAADGTYGGRCLCIACYTRARRSGSLQDWPLPPRQEGAGRRHTDTPLHRLVRVVGASAVAGVMGRSLEDVRGWFDGVAPDEITTLAREELARLREEGERRALAFHRERRRDTDREMKRADGW